MNKRVMNVRPLFVAAIGIMAGIFISQLFWVSNNAENIIVGSSIFLVALVPLLALIVLGSVLNSNGKFALFLKFHKKNFIILLAFLLLGNAVMAVNSIIYNNAYPEYVGEFIVVGEIEDNFYEKNNITVLTLSDVVISGDSATFTLPSRMRVVLFATGIIGESGISANNAITLQCEIVKVPFENSGYNFSNYINNTIYSASSVSNFSFQPSRYNADEFIRNEYKTILQNTLPNENANIAYSLLFGNDEVLSNEIMQLFTYSGVVHIISVSGLHVAVLVLVLSYILHKLKTNKYVMLGIMLVVLVFYSYLCGFVPSVIRSALMSMVFLLSLNIGEKYDSLSALSLSAVIILLFRPMEMFSLGFLLSFISMFALITIAPMLNNVLKKLKLPKSIASPISLTLSATLLTFPIIAFYFNEVAIYSIISNLIVVPLLSLAYILVFAICTFAIVFNFLSVLLIVPQILIHFSKIFLQLIVELPLSVVTVFSDGFLSLLLLMLLVFVLKFVMLKARAKSLLCGALGIIFVLVIIIHNLPKTYNNYSLSTVYQTNSNYSVITTSNSETVLVGGDIENLTELKKLTVQLKIHEINAVIAYDYNFKNHNNLVDACKKYNVSTLYVYVLDSSLFDFVSQEFAFVNNVIIINDEHRKDIDGAVSFHAIIELNKVLGIEMHVSDSKLLFLVNNLTKQNMLPLRFRENMNYHFVVVNNVNFDLTEFNITTYNLVTHKNNKTKNVKVYSIWNLTNFTIGL